MDFPGVSKIKNPPANAGSRGDTSWIPGFGISLGEGNSNSLQYSCLENSMNREAWQATVQMIEKSRMQLGD